MSSENNIIVSASQHDTRVALVSSGHLERLWIDPSGRKSLVGNIYKGKVSYVDRGIQAAFVDCGLERPGFLHIRDINHSFFGIRARQERIGHRVRRSERPPIERCLRVGDEVIVQVVKDGYAHKGVALTTYISVPGRTLVMLPGGSGMGISRRIDQAERDRLRQLLHAINLPENTGFILRTAGNGVDAEDIVADAQHLSKVWEVAMKRAKLPAPVELLRESDTAIQAVRDWWVPGTKIIVDKEAVARKIRRYLNAVIPATKGSRLVRLHRGNGMFHKYGLEHDMKTLESRTVLLPSGGSIVIEPTEALISIDVNSGKTHGRRSEDTACRTNLEAAEEVARQLRLRDLGGLVAVDFIDMDEPAHRRQVEDVLRRALERPRERVKILPMSDFGIVELTRQRTRATQWGLGDPCPHCNGSGRTMFYSGKEGNGEGKAKGF